MKNKPQLSAGDYFTLFYAMSRAAVTLTWTSLTGWTRGDDCPKDYKRHVMYSTSRSLFPHITVHHMQASAETTAEAYKTFAKKNKIEIEIVELEHEALGCFLGPKTAKKTLLWFHGGGYAVGAGPAHFRLLLDFVKLAAKNGLELRVMLLEYELAPHGSYPLQLKQGVAGLTYLLNSGLQSSQILLGGDSAGGNLAAGVLGHLSHPNPAAPAVSLSNNLAGVFLISPWVTFDQNSEAFRRNVKKDGLNASALRIWSNNLMGKSARDNYNHPKDAPAEWWKGLKADHVGIVAGADEILVDDIREWVETIKVNNPDVEYLEAAGEAHDNMIADRTFGIADDLASEKFVNEWLLTRLKET